MKITSQIKNNYFDNYTSFNFTIFQLNYPMSALNSAASIPKTAAISSLSDVSPDIPTEPTTLLFLSLIKTPPGTGTSSPLESAFTALIKYACCSALLNSALDPIPI